MKIQDIIAEAYRLGVFDEEDASNSQLEWMTTNGGETTIVGSNNGYNVHQYKNYPDIFTIEKDGGHIAQIGFNRDKTHPVLQYAYVKIDFRKIGVLKGFLSVLRNNTKMFPILIGHSVSNNMIDFIKSLNGYNRFWYNTQTGDKDPYIEGTENKYFSDHSPENQQWVYMLE